MKELNSEISGFYKLNVEERQKKISQLIDLSQDDLELLREFGYFKSNELDTLIENVIGSYQLPMGIACNFKINNKDYLIPMVIEEPSVVAAASNLAKIARKRGGFFSDEVKPIMISQIQVTNLNDIIKAKEELEKNKIKLLEIANEKDPLLNKLGGGALDLEIREIETRKGKMLILHLLVNVLDAMGANVVALARPLLAPAIESSGAILDVLAGFIEELRVCLHGAGAENLAELRKAGVEPV